MKLRTVYTCPLELVHDMIRGKWQTILLFTLKNGEKSFSQLMRDVNGVTEKMLLAHLADLRRFGLVEKRADAGYPLHTVYFLTTRGRRLEDAVEIMQEVGVDYMLENGQRELLEQKGICCTGILTKK